MFFKHIISAFRSPKEFRFSDLTDEDWEFFTAYMETELEMQVSKASSLWRGRLSNEVVCRGDSVIFKVQKTFSFDDIQRIVREIRE